MFELLFFAAGVLAVGFFKSIISAMLIMVFLSIIIIKNKDKLTVERIIILVFVFIFGISYYSVNLYKVKSRYGNVESKGEYTVTVISDVETTDDYLNFTGRIKEFDNTKAIIRLKSSEKVKYQDILSIEGKLLSVNEDGYISGFDSEGYYYSKKIYLRLIQDGAVKKLGQTTNLNTYIYKLKDKIRYITNMNFSYDSGNFLKGILLGSADGGKEETKNALKTTGLSHIVVVSGMHFAVINMFIIFILRRMRIKRKTSSLISIFTSLMFALFIGFTPSVTRAFVMITMLNIADLINRERETDIHLILVTAVIIILINPFIINNSGFILSYGAVTGIVLFNKKIYEFIKIPNGYVKEIIAVSLSSNIVIFPLLIYFFRGFPLFFLATNLIMNMLLPAIMLLGIILIILSFVSIKIGYYAGIPLDYMIRAIIDVIVKISKIPASYQSTISIESYYIILFYIALYVGIRFRKSFIKYIVTLLVSLYFIMGMFIPVENYISLRAEVIYYCGSDSGRVLISYKGDSVFIDLSLHNKLNYKELIDSKFKGKVDTVILGDVENVFNAAENELKGERLYYPKVNSLSNYMESYISNSSEHNTAVDEIITVKTDKMVLTLKPGKSYNISEVTVEINGKYITVTSDFNTIFREDRNYIVTDVMRQMYNNPNILNCMENEIERKLI